MQLTGKNIILTGASSGIGKEILRLLVLHKDVKIVAVARDITSIEEVPNVVYPLSVDVSTKQGIDTVFKYAEETIGNVTVFIANAGLAYIEKMSAADWQHIEYIYSLNVFSPIYALQKLNEKQCDTPKAFICTISAVAFASLPAYSLYCSTKAALHHFIETYRYEQDANLQITAIYPIATRTAFFDKATKKENTPLPYMSQDAKVVATKIVRGIEKGKKRVYPSLMFRLTYPFTRSFPFLFKIYAILEKRKVKHLLRS